MKNTRSYKIGFGIALGLTSYLALLLGLAHAEQGANGASIQSFSDALWYSAVTLTTVGYGDFYPVTPIGKIIGYIFVFGSFGVLGLLIGKLSSIISAVRQEKYLGYKGTNFVKHIVIIGWNQFAASVVQELVTAKIKVAIVTNDINSLELIKEKYDKKYVYVLLSDLNNFRLIEKSNINKSSSIFINIEDDTEKLVYFLNSSKHFSPSLDYVVITQNPELNRIFHDAGIRYALSIEEFASKIIASYIFEPDVAEYVEDLLASALDENDHDIKQYLVTTDNPYIGMKYNSVFYKVKEQFDTILIGMVKIDENEKRELFKNPNNEELTIAEGDFLILITNGSAADKLSVAFNVCEGSAGN